MNILQQLQKKKLSIIESIIDNLQLLLNTYCSNINAINAYGINYFSINLDNILTIIEREEPRIHIINIEKNDQSIDVEFMFNNQIYRVNNG